MMIEELAQLERTEKWWGIWKRTTVVSFWTSVIALPTSTFLPLPTIASVLIFSGALVAMTFAVGTAVLWFLCYQVATQKAEELFWDLGSTTLFLEENLSKDEGAVLSELVKNGLGPYPVAQLELAISIVNKREAGAGIYGYLELERYHGNICGPVLVCLNDIQRPAPWAFSEAFKRAVIKRGRRRVEAGGAGFGFGA